MTKAEIERRIEDLLFCFWATHLYKKNIKFTDWFYGENGINDQLNKILEIEND